MQVGARDAVVGRANYEAWKDTALCLSTTGSEHRSKDLTDFWRASDHIEWARKRHSPDLSAEQTTVWLHALVGHAEQVHAGSRNMPLDQAMQRLISAVRNG